jgi:hypothetical protein
MFFKIIKNRIRVAAFQTVFHLFDLNIGVVFRRDKWHARARVNRFGYFLNKMLNYYSVRLRTAYKWAFKELGRL